MSPESKRPVTVEDLIRLKRVEQPPAEFWDGFDRQLRAKQLAALVEKRAWWQKMPHAWPGWKRYYLPLGATAALALTLFSVREHGSSGPASSTEGRVANVTAPPTEAMGRQVALQNVAFRPSVEESPTAAISMESEARAADVADTAATIASAAPVVSSENVQDVPLLGAQEGLAPTREERPSARHIAANLAALQISEPAFPSGLLAVTGSNSEVQATPTRVARLEPLAQVVGPAEAQSRRRLSQSPVATVAAFFPANPSEDVTERQARNLSTDQLYESRKGRLKATGNSVSMGFGRL